MAAFIDQAAARSVLLRLRSRAEFAVAMRAHGVVGVTGAVVQAVPEFRRLDDGIVTLRARVRASARRILAAGRAALDGAAPFAR